MSEDFLRLKINNIFSIRYWQQPNTKIYRIIFRQYRKNLVPFPWTSKHLYMDPLGVHEPPVNNPDSCLLSLNAFHI